MKVLEIGGITLSLSLLSDFTNSKDLLDLMQAGILDPEAAIINASFISESLKRCGISDSTNYILEARFGASADEMTTIKGLVKGIEINLGELETLANQAQIQKLYSATKSRSKSLEYLPCG